VFLGWSGASAFGIRGAALADAVVGILISLTRAATRAPRPRQE
jgi:hypothetical protein